MLASPRRNGHAQGAMKQSFFYYCAIALVIVGSVVFGLDWQSPVLTPMPPIQVVALPPPPPRPPAPVVVTPAVPAVPAPAPAPVAKANPVAAPAVAPAAPSPPKALCDVAACAAAYRSFQESDCTYNPSSGPRRLCTKGVVPTQAAPSPPPAQTAPQVPPPVDVPVIANPEPGSVPKPDAPAIAGCNVSACAAAYRSFRESDCTFNPSFGPRQVCKK